MENIDPRNSGIPPVRTPPVLQRDGAVNSNPSIATVDISPSSNRNAPLAGKKIFMHCESTGVTVIRNLEMVLRKLQAELVPFFSRDVHYVVTTRPASRLPPPKANSLGAQLTKKTPTVGRQAQLTTGRLSESINRSHTLAGSRGRAMLLAAVQKKASPTTTAVNDTLAGGQKQPPLRGVSPSQASSVLRQLQTENAVAQSEANPIESTKTDLAAAEKATLCTTGGDLLSRARQLGIKILTVDMVLKWIHHLPPDVQHYIQSPTLHADALREELAANDVAQDPERDRFHNVRALATPCIKVLNLTGDYRPLFLDHTKYAPSLWRLLQAPQAGTCSEASLCLKSTQASVGGGSWVSQQQPTTGAAAAPVGTSLGLAGTGQTQDTTNVGTNNNTTNNPVSRQHSRLEAQAPALGAPVVRNKSMLLLQRSNQRCAKVRPRRLRRSVTTPVLDILGGRQTPLKGNQAVEPSGYCECCATIFKNLAEHLTCEDHRHFAENVENYRSLDAILDRIPGPQLFLKAEQQRRRRQEQLRLQSKPPAVVPQPSGKCSGSATTGQTPEGVKSVKGTPETCPPETRSGGDPPVPLDATATVKPRSPAKSTDYPPQLPAPPALNTTAIPLSVCRRLLLFSSSSSSSSGDGSGGCSGGLPLIGVLKPDTVQTTELQVTPTVPATRHSAGHVTDVVDLEVHPAQLGDSRVAWQTVCDQVYTGDPHPGTSNCTPSNPSGTPALEVFHRACPRCSRVHIPTRRSRKLQLQSFTLLGPDHDTCSGLPGELPSVGEATPLCGRGFPPAPISQEEGGGAGVPPGAPVLPLTSIADPFSFLLPVCSSNGCSPTNNQPSRPASAHSEERATNQPTSVMKQLMEWSSFDPSTCPPSWTAGSSRRTRTEGVDCRTRRKAGQLVRPRRDRRHAPASRPEKPADGGCGTPSPVCRPSTRRQSLSVSPSASRSRPTTCRNAARVARESISLSIMALFSPGTLDAEVANGGGGRHGRRARACRSEAHARLFQPSNPVSPAAPLPSASTPPS